MSWLFDDTLSTILATVKHLCTRYRLTAVTSQLVLLPFQVLSEDGFYNGNKCLCAKTSFLHYHQVYSHTLNVIQ